MGKKIALTALIIAASLLLYSFSSDPWPGIDTEADAYFNRTLADAALAYATVRGVNAVVSVLKESQIELSPAGVGVTIAAGQILDPIDDLAERLSTVLVAALVSLGLQKLLLEISRHYPLVLLAATALIFILPVWSKTSGTSRLTASIFRVCLLLVVLRLILPFSSLLNDYLYNELLSEEISAARTTLSTVASRQDAMTVLDEAEHGSLFTALSQSTRKRIEDARDLYRIVLEHGDAIIESLLRLTTLYVALFILQVILIPLAVLWLLLKTVNWLLQGRPVVLSVADGGEQSR